MSHRAHNWSKLQKAGGPGRKGLLLLIADMCDENLECFPSIALLAQIMETSERYIRGMLQDLEDAKLIASEFRYRNGRRTSSLYRVLVPEGFVEVSTSTHYRNHGSATTGTMVPKLPEPEFLAEPPVEPPVEPSAVAQARDQSRPPSNPPAIAEVAAIAEAPAGAGASANGKSAGKVGEATRRDDTRQRDDSWRLQLQAADLDDLYDALSSYHKERQDLEEWAYRTAASDLGIDFGAHEEVPEQADGDWTRLTYLYLLKKHDSDPGDQEIQSALLEPLDGSIQAPERSYRVVQKLPPPAGVSPREFADQMKAAVTLMEPTEIGPYIAEFRDVRRGVWWESLAEAEKLLRTRKQKVTAQAKNYVALHVAIDRYVGRGTWEMELVPPSMRSQGWQSPGEAPPWAA